MVKIFSLFSLGVGVFLLSQVLLPILSYQWWERVELNNEVPLITPSINKSKVLGVSVVWGEDNFPALVSTTQRIKLYDSFILSVPSLNIKDAKVLVDSNNLDKALAHLPGTALPGERGNVFISGHSGGFRSYLAGDDYKYKSIFSNLYKLKKEEVIIINVEGQTFKYRVLGIRVVDPKDLSVVNPPDEMGRYITLMTCVPPGINSKRLVVLGKLE